MNYIVWTFILSFLDFMSTVYALSNGATELNPRIQELLVFGPMGFFLGRVLYVPLVLWFSFYFLKKEIPSLFQWNIEIYFFFPLFIAWSIAILQNFFGFI